MSRTRTRHASAIASSTRCRVSGVEEVQAELGAHVLQLAGGLPSVPFMTAAEGLGERDILAQIESELRFVVSFFLRSPL